MKISVLKEKTANPPNSPLNTPTPRLISKKQLAIIFKVFTGSGNHGKVLRKKYFDDKALEDLGMSLKIYNKRKQFNRFETPLIIAYFKITESELKEL